MTRTNWRGRANRRFTALGLALSVALIVSANGVISSTSAQEGTVSVDCAVPTDPAKIHTRAESPPRPAAVHLEGHPQFDQVL